MDLLHYVSANYDPQKAHEYYLQNRQLKGKHSTKGFTQKQKEAWSYAQAQIRAKTKEKNVAASTSEKTSIEQTREQAQQLRQEISAKLKAFNDMLTQGHSANVKSISEQSKAQHKAIADKLVADLAALPDIPKNLPKDQSDKLVKERADKIAALKGQAASDREDLNKAVADVRLSERTSTQETRQDNSTNVQAQRAQVAQDLKGVVEKYRAQYQSARQANKSESGATLDKEFNNIKSKVR
jgi:hypothetical protein